MAGDRPLVSVVIPVYQASTVLERSLASVDAQTLHDLEIVVVDDGSEDGSAEIARSFSHDAHHSVTVLARSHGGRALARQAGVDAARGELIGFVDADDAAAPALFAELSAAFRRGPDVDAAVCRYRNVIDGEPGHVYEEGDAALFGGRLTDNPELLAQVEASLCNKLFRKTLFAGVKFPAGRDFEDLATTYRLLGAARRIEKVDGPPLYDYHLGGPASVMAAHDARYEDIGGAIEVTCEHFRAAGDIDALEGPLLRLALRHLIFARFGGFFDNASPATVRSYTDRAYEVLDAQFPGWRRSDALRRSGGSWRSRALVRSKPALRAFLAVRSCISRMRS